jgi:fatty acid desaturase
VSGGKGLARNPADWAPALAVTAGVALALLPFALALPLPAVIALGAISIALRSVAPVHQHCHAHLQIFRHPTVNALYDAILALAAGNITAVWELQHVAGHHRSYLTPEADPAACGRFGNSRVAFTVLGDASSFTDSLAIARRTQRGTARLWRQQLGYLALLAGLVAWSPWLALALFVAPALLLRWAVFWVSYSQHAGAPLVDVYSGSITHFGLSNRFYLNVGHHTAHHEKPTLHWTQLPARTARIAARIPAECLR